VTGPADADRTDILVVEDSDVDFMALERTLHRFRPDLVIERALDGDVVVERFSATSVSALPRLVMLDLNLPTTDGRKVLRHLRGLSALADVPIVVLTTSSSPLDVEQCYADGANSYLFKPVNYALFEATIRGAVDYWLTAPALVHPPAAVSAD